MTDESKKQPGDAEAVGMEPEPMLVVDGVIVSDLPLHTDILEGEEAEQLADLFALHTAVELGYTPEEAIKLIGGRFTLDSMRPDTV
jgi:hypothetical protein